MNTTAPTLSASEWFSNGTQSPLELQSYFPLRVTAGQLGIISACCFAAWHYLSRSPQGNLLIHAPTVGPKHSLTARWWFFRNGWAYIEEGYSKYKDTLFKLSGNDIVVIPRRYVDELRNMPDEHVSSIQANVDSFEGLYSTTNILLEGTLHTRTIQRRLTPKLASIIPSTQEELTLGLEKELQISPGQWTEKSAMPLILRVVSYVAARHFVGYPLCQDENWISTALEYTDNAFKTIVLIRMFPDWLKPVLVWLIPYSYHVTRALRRAKRIIIPLIQERRKNMRENPDWEAPNDLLQWMIEGAEGYEGRPEKLTHRLLILTLASVHTTSMAATQTLFDLCHRPEYKQELLEEVNDALAVDGGLKKQTLTRLRKMDSFMRESQRLSPPSLLGFKRYLRKPFTFADGLSLPAGAHLMVAIYPIVVDEEFTSDPMTFDGLRFFEERKKPGESNKHQFATTSNTNMHFGHGKFSCPGRFLASNTIKLVMINLLLKYDFELEDDYNVKRPDHLCVHEFVFPNPWAKIKLRLKPDASWMGKL